MEQRAIETLLHMGAKLNVPLKIGPRKMPRFYRWWNRHFPNRAKIWRDKRIPKGWDVTIESQMDQTTQKLESVYVRHFHIKPLYLGTIDALRRLYLTIAYNEEAFDKAPWRESQQYFRYIDTVCEIAAIAVLNSCEVTNTAGKEVRSLKIFFKEHLTVARLRRLAEVISQMMNPVGFTASIRLIREIGTTQPKPQEQRIE